MKKKNREKKKISLCRTWKGYCLIELGGWARLGAQGAGRAQAGAGRAAGAQAGALACAGVGAGRWALGAGRQGACVLGVLGARGRRA